MKAARYYVYPLLCCVAFFAGMRLFQLFMFAKANEWIEHAVAIPLYDRILYEIAHLWSATWWLFIFPALLLSILVGALTHALKKTS